MIKTMKQLVIEMILEKNSMSKLLEDMMTSLNLSLKKRGDHLNSEELIEEGEDLDLNIVQTLTQGKTSPIKKILISIHISL